jgi:hypothetical protein
MRQDKSSKQVFEGIEMVAGNRSMLHRVKATRLMFALIMRVVGAPLLMGLLGLASAASARTIFVSAAAGPGGNGSEQSPFNSLAAVEQASAPGDEIVVLAAPTNSPPLDGGIALKPRQKLTGRGPSVVDPSAPPAAAARIANSTADHNSGDAILLADGVEVSNLMVVKSYRGGIYGVDVTDVDVHDNNLTGLNSSCAPGFYVMFPVNQPLLPNPWAAILADEDKGTNAVSIRNNYIHDGICNDGIDIRATGAAIVMARVEHNNVTHLLQGEKMRSLLGIGMQARDTAVLTVDSDYNSETYIGSPGADCEGLFGNQTGGTLTWNINHNTFAHGIGGGSCNGGEFFLSSGPSTMNIYISHSTFEDDPGDMIEEINEATSSTNNLTLEDVTVSRTPHPNPLPDEPKFFGGDVNRYRCVAQSSHGHANANNLRILDSRFTDCGGDAIGTSINGSSAVQPPPPGAAPGAANPFAQRQFGDGIGDFVSIDVENSVVADPEQYAVHVMNEVAIKELNVRLENNQFTGARGPAVLGFDQNASTERYSIDLGGKDSGSAGGNCIVAGKSPAIEATGYDVTARSNWWGRADGPASNEVSATNAKIDASSPLKAAPAGCQKR